VVGPHVRYRGSTLSPQELSATFYDGVLLAQIAERRSSLRKIGLIMLHGASVMDGYAYLSLIAQPNALRTGLLVEAGLAFLRHAFDTWPLRKIYIEAAETTLP
jgi:RimJ/RimL family protein N-acetyltransferase